MAEWENTGIGTWGGWSPHKICERGAQPLWIECAFVNTYLKLGLYILLAHDYCTNTPTASCVCPVQWFKERQRVHISTNVQCDLININQPISFSVPRYSWIIMSPLTPNIFLRYRRMLPGDDHEFLFHCIKLKKIQQSRHAGDQHHLGEQHSQREN